MLIVKLTFVIKTNVTQMIKYRRNRSSRVVNGDWDLLQLKLIAYTSAKKLRNLPPAVVDKSNGNFMLTFYQVHTGVFLCTAFFCCLQ